MNSQLHVLIVEDDADVAMACEQALQLEGYECGCMSSAEMAQKHLSADFAGVVVSDIRLPRMSGLDLLAAVHAMDAELPVILITGHGDISMAVQAMKDGAQDFLEKPFAPERLTEAVRRVLERLGSNTLIPVDCRVIAATKVDLLALSQQGLFRADLYYRLNVITVNLPPLRERREDIPLLFEHFALQAAARHQRPVPELTPQRLQALMAHDWPGNVRELRNMAERMTLGIDMGLQSAQPQAAEPSLAATVEAIERALIVDALRSHDGSLTRAAQALGTPKTTLHDKMRKYGL